MPPHVIVKKLTQAGWIVGNRAEEDICPACQKRQTKTLVQSHVTVANKALAGIFATTDPPKTSDHFAVLLQSLALLSPEQARQAMKVLRDRIPKQERVEKVPPPPPPPPPSEAEYQRWLNDIEAGK
jgi:hypothetical protein